jgi:RNAse (barnase) inhibitor barstar
MMRIDASRIVDSESFHSVFASAFGFPEFYGRNMNAWIDCLTSLDDPDAGMTTVQISPGQTLPLVIEHARDLKARCPELFAALIECAAFVNWRRIESGEPAVLALALYA